MEIYFQEQLLGNTSWNKRAIRRAMADKAASTTYFAHEYQLIRAGSMRYLWMPMLKSSWNVVSRPPRCEQLKLLHDVDVVPQPACIGSAQAASKASLSLGTPCEDVWLYNIKGRIGRWAVATGIGSPGRDHWTPLSPLPRRRLGLRGSMHTNQKLTLIKMFCWIHVSSIDRMQRNLFI
jgi:hypothetical protein